MLSTFLLKRFSIFYRLITHFSLTPPPRLHSESLQHFVFCTHTSCLKAPPPGSKLLHLSQSRPQVQNLAKLVYLYPSCPTRDKQLFHTLYLTEVCLGTHSAPGDVFASRVVTVISTMDSLFSNTVTPASNLLIHLWEQLTQP